MAKITKAIKQLSNAILGTVLKKDGNKKYKNYLDRKAGVSSL